MTGCEAEEKGNGAFGPFFWCGEVGRSGFEAAAQHIRVNDTGIEGDGGECAGEFLSEGECEAFDGPFGGAVGGDFGGGGASPAGAEVDDDA